MKYSITYKALHSTEIEVAHPITNINTLQEIARVIAEKVGQPVEVIGWEGIPDAPDAPEDSEYPGYICPEEPEELKDSEAPHE